MTTTLFDLIRRYIAGDSNLTDSDATHLLYMVYTLCKVRGYKTVSKLFPHSVEDLEPTYKLLEKFRDGARTPAPNITAEEADRARLHPLLFQAHQFALDEIEWRVPYVLLLWLSVIGLIPFDLNALDNDSTGSVPLKHKLLNIGHHFLQQSSITRNAASELLSTLLTRPDMKAELAEFIQKAISTVKTLSSVPPADQLVTASQYLVAGLYHTLSLLFQKGERELLAPHVSTILSAFFPATKTSGPSNNAEEEELEYDLPSNALINKKLSVKLVQRLGLVLLPPRIPKWRYQRRTVSLLSNLKSTTASSAPLNPNTNANAAIESHDDEEEEEYEIPEELEIFVQLLLSALRDKDTIVRWSAAKGIGRLTHRLSQTLADEIVGSLVELFDESETDCAWHGACLAIAELARRGLLLPSRLPELLEKLTKALLFEIRRGAHTTGHHVRDAACYVAWALARAYDPALLRNYLAVSLASSLLISALFDREVNCRRAAAAAFQEHVGRQGSFPHGIDIISIVNFFTLSNRSEAYLTLAPQIAAYEEYAKPLIDHLAFHKAAHVDHNIRTLAAKALGKLALQAAHLSYITTTIVPKLIPLATNPDFATRQGSIQTLAEITHALSSVSNDILAQESTLVADESETKIETGITDSGVAKSADNIDEKHHEESLKKRSEIIARWLPTEVQEKLWNIPADVERARLYRGRGAEYLRISVCRLILSISELGMSLKSSGVSAAKTIGLVGNTKPRGPAIAQRLAAGHSAAKASKDTLTFFIETIEENLRQALETIINVAVDATRSLSARYLHSSTALSNGLVDRWMNIIATDTNQAARRGHCLAIGALPLSSISPAKLPQIISCLLKATQIIGKKSTMDDAEVRRNAIIGLSDLVARLDIVDTEPSQDISSVTTNTENSGENSKNVGENEEMASEKKICMDCKLSRSQIHEIKQAYLTCMDDYTTDNRGDIGSLVREAAISAFGQLIVKLRSHDIEMLAKDEIHSPMFSVEEMKQFLGRLVRLALEKIDRTRERAGVMFEQLVRCAVHQPSTASMYRFASWTQVSFDGVSLELADGEKETAKTESEASSSAYNTMIPHAEEIWKAMEEANELLDARSVITKGLNWSSSRVAFPMLVSIMRFPEYRYWVNLGIIRSVGGVNNSKELVEDATSALMNHLRALKDTSELNNYGSVLIDIMKSNAGNEQVITSLWSTMDIVLSSSSLSSTLSPPTSSFAPELLALSRAELRIPSSISKLTASVPVFAHLLSFKGNDAIIVSARESALKMMLFFLAYKYPVIRKLAAETLYLQLETSDHFVDPNMPNREESIEKAREILTTVSWAWDAEFNSAKESLSVALGIKVFSSK